MTFNALLATQTSDRIATDVVQLEEGQLMAGNVTVAVEYSTVNEKDALAVTGRGPIIRQFPLIPGIDFSGVVVASSHPRFHIRTVVDVNA
ncbi:alcohol dehydrogenase catalytic domain-containing protein [Xanthomonas campestris]|uniref:alcohol dehydrogenase catalytic domain-containing protein n=1 Tax=Xanthomonas TaxID=338 RepID=UPI001E2850FF|nr:alcohol dehydrogenase catalytic domain-containing protein [Xanthomonas campestris]MCC5089702.1 alcohol dehydrogenase catalytic domain-containing protein [Xanthomonas campestris]